MKFETLAEARQLILDTRYLCGEGKAPTDGRFGELLARLDDSRAGAWLRYCCENLRVLVRTDPRAAWDFADAVHNAPALDGMEVGRFRPSREFWDFEIEPFRARYGAAYFADFEGDVE
jgi:hypothetical protein